MRLVVTGALLDIKPGSQNARDMAAAYVQAAGDAVRSLQQQGQAPELFRRSVAGRVAVDGELDVLPGPINYKFDWIREATQFALDELVRLSPRRSGRYRSSFVVLADGRATPPSEIPARARVDIVNVQPYSRKIQVGSAGFEKYRDLFEKVKRRVKSEYAGLADARVTFMRLPGSGYVLKASAPLRAVKPSLRSSAFRAGRAYLRARPDRSAGADMTYPVLMVWSKDEIVV